MQGIAKLKRDIMAIFSKFHTGQWAIFFVVLPPPNLLSKLTYIGLKSVDRGVTSAQKPLPYLFQNQHVIVQEISIIYSQNSSPSLCHKMIVVSQQDFSSLFIS